MIELQKRPDFLISVVEGILSPGQGQGNSES